MGFDQHLDQSFIVQRDTSNILTSTSISVTLSATYQPSTSCHLNVHIDSASAFGQVFISGTDESDAAQSELFTFSKNTVKPGTNFFKTVTGITTSGFTGGDIRINGVQRSGSELNVRRDVKTINARVYNPETTYHVRTPGAAQERVSRIMIKSSDNDLLKGDYLVGSDSFSYQLTTSLQPRRGGPGTGIHHYEADIEQIES